MNSPRKTNRVKVFAISMFVLLFIFSFVANRAYSATFDTVSAGLNGAYNTAVNNPLQTINTLGSNAIIAGGVAATTQALSNPSNPSDDIYCWRSSSSGTGGATVAAVGIPNDFNIPGCLAIGSYMVLYVSSYVLWVAAIFFDYTIQYSLAMRNLVKGFAAIQYGWEIFRNFINLFFILILVYIAIATILQIEGYGYKKLLGKLVMAAFLINFSMFFTEVIIDVSNITALVFYKQILKDAKTVSDGNAVYQKGIAGTVASTATDVSKTAADTTNQWVSFGIMNSLGLSSVWGAKGSVGITPTGGNNALTLTGVSATNSTGAITATDPWTLILVGLGGSVFVLILSFVFFAAAIMFILRIISLIILIITSPVAFAARVLPKTSKYSDTWWNHLTKNALFAPAYMAMMFITLKMVWGANSKEMIGGNLMRLFIGDHTGIQAVVFFILLCAMLIMCITISSSFGTAGAKTVQGWGKSAGTWGKNYAKRRAFAPVSYVADRASKSAFLAKRAPLLLRGADKLAQSKIGGSSYRSRGEESKKVYAATSELIKKVASGNLNRLTGETDKLYSDRKTKQLTAGTKAQKRFLGINPGADGKGNVVESTSWFRGKNMAMQELVEKGMKATTNDFTKSTNSIKVSSQKTLGSLEEEMNKMEGLISDPTLTSAIKVGSQESFDQADGAHEQIKPEKLYTIIKNLTTPLQKINRSIEGLSDEIETHATAAASPTATPQQVERAKNQMILSQIKKDRLTGVAASITAAKNKIESDAHKLQEIEIAKGTQEAIEKNKPSTP